MPRFPSVLRLLRAVRHDRRGNVLMLFGFAILPLTFAIGMGIDYGRAMRTQTKMNAAADAAALAAVSQTLMQSNEATAYSAAQQMFIIQTQGLSGLVPMNYLDPSQLTITITDTTPTGSTSHKRNVTVSYVAKSQNSFATLLNMPTLNIRGTSAATASNAPNIDFYMLLDISSSMAIPTTSDGLNLLSSKTPDGCMFACHNTNDTHAPDANGNWSDYYGIAKSYNIPLRIDSTINATSSLTNTAKSMSSTNHAQYRMAITTFSEASTFTKVYAPNDQPGDLTAAGTAASGISIPLYYTNGFPSQTRYNNDQDTATSDAFDKITAWMPTGGNGTNQAGDTPQAIMFIITDGMRDEVRIGGKPEVAIDTSKCTTIKNKNIRIAVLYTEYLPQAIANNSWSTDPNQGNVYNRINQIEPALQSCASPGLYYKVTTGDDITAALNSLFQKAVASAHLTQ